MRADIVPGAKFPDYELTDHARQRRKLSEIQGIDPMIVVLSRGHFCPKDHQQHLELAAFYPKIAVAYTKIVTISTDNILESNEFRDAVGAQWPFLSDSGRKVQQDLDIQEYTDPYHDPMIPHTLVLEPGLVIHKVYNGYWFWGRPSTQDLWADLREVTKQVPPRLGPRCAGPARQLRQRRQDEALALRRPRGPRRPHRRADRARRVRWLQS